MPAVLIWDPLPADGRLDWLVGLCARPGLEVLSAREGDEGGTETHLPTADALVILRRPLTPTALEQAKRLQLVQLVGADPAPLAEVAERLEQRGIPSLTLPADYFIQAVAEHTLMCLLVLAKEAWGPRVGAVQRNRLALEPVETTATRYSYNWLGLARPRLLRGKTVGLVGLGKIGRRVARLLRPLGMTALYYQRNALPPEMEEELGVTYAPYDRLLGQSDVVTLHVPYNQDTHHLLGEEELALMKPDSVLINTSRGRVVNQEALARALRRRRIRAAALDVYAVEPPGEGNPLLELDNVFLTPHIAAGVLESLDHTAGCS